jgi:hypothetical protein
MLDQTEVIDNVSDLSVTVAGCYEDPTVADALAEMYRAETEVTEAEVEAMHREMEAAAAADDIDFGPFDLAAWEETMSRYPENTGLVPVIGPVPWTDGTEMYRAELRRARKDGTGWDVVPCLFWPTQKEAWAACVSRALTMVCLCENGRRDMAERMFVNAEG